MTANDIYQKCKLWMFDKADSTTYDASILQVINKVLAEVYDDNNMMRMFHNIVPLTSIPQCTSLSDELGLNGLGYTDEFLLEIIPKGVCANLLMDDDLNKMSMYQTEYNNARVEKQVMVSPEKIAKLEALANAD